MRHPSGDAPPRPRLRAGLALAAALSASTAWTGVASAQSAAYATPVQSTDGSHPFNAALYARIGVDLSAVKYVEKEYFLSGTAKAYAYNNPGTATDDSVSPVQTASVPFVNRILVRAPQPGQPFSGNVIVEIANDALISDNETQWPFANNQFIANGDAYVLITSTPNGLATLKAYAPTRYHALNWPTVGATKSCDSGQPEGGVIYDQITELGNLLRSGNSFSPLKGYAVKHLFLTGYSGAASILLTYDRVFSLTSSLWDAYFVAAGGFRAPLNNCEASSTASSRTEPPASTVAAVFQTQTESELALASFAGVTIPNSPNTNSPRYRYYEIAGTAHVNGDLVEHSPERSDFPVIPNVVYLTDVTQSGLSKECSNEPSGSVFSAFPNRYVYDSLWANLEQWVTAPAGTYNPPTAGKITDTGLFTYLGAEAPTGGVRSPAVDVPIDAYQAGSTPPSGAVGGLGAFCELTGTQTSKTTTVNGPAVIADATTLAGQGFLTAADLAALTAKPSLAYTYPDGSTTIPDNPPPLP